MTTFDYEQMLGLVERLGEPDYEYVAAAGKRFGRIRAWDIRWRWGDDHLIAVEDGDEVGFDVVSLCDEDSLPDILEETLSTGDETPLERVLLRAHVHGIDAVDAVTAEPAIDRGVYVVLATRFFNEPREETRAVEDDKGDVLEFETYAEVKEYVDGLDEGVHYLLHGEYARPKYTIVNLVC